MLVTGGYSKKVIVQDPKLETPKRIHDIEIDSQINCLKVTQKNNSHIIAVGGCKHLVLLEHESGTIHCKKQKNVGNICSLNFLAENELYTAEYSGLINFYDIRKMNEPFRTVRAFDERINTSCVEKNQDLTKPMAIWSSNPKGMCSVVNLADPNFNDPQKAQGPRTFNLSRVLGESYAMRQSRYNHLLLGDTKGYISIISENNTEQCQKFNVHDGFIFKLKNFYTVDSDHEILISSGQDCSVNVYKLTKDNKTFNLEKTKTIKTRKICQDLQIINNYVFVACSDNFIQLQDTNSRDTNYKFKQEGHSRAVTSLCQQSSSNN